MTDINREFATYTVVCDECGTEHESTAEWLDTDPCMPERVQ